MERKYSNTVEATNEVKFFYGIEVEHSPAHNMNTLFVTGIHSLESILDYAEPTPVISTLYRNRDNSPIKHIYCGANQSYQPNNPDEFNAWSGMVYSLLKKGFWVTLDFDAKYVEQVHESGLCEQRKFIPMISVKLPYIELFNYNTTIKIDDIGFEATNPGVWCHRLHDLKRTEKFTSWDAYNDDKVIK